jgi:hypothetical protein
MILLYAKIDDKSVRSKYVALVDCELDLKEILLTRKPVFLANFNYVRLGLCFGIVL